MRRIIATIAILCATGTAHASPFGPSTWDGKPKPPPVVVPDPCAYDIRQTEEHTRWCQLRDINRKLDRIVELLEKMRHD